MKRKTIPQIRERLYVLAEQWDLPELAQLADQTRRVHIKLRAPAEAKPIDAVLKARILRFYCKNPRAQINYIAEKFGVNQGRVSEIIGGKR